MFLKPRRLEDVSVVITGVMFGGGDYGDKLCDVTVYSLFIDHRVLALIEVFRMKGLLGIKALHGRCRSCGGAL